MEKKKEIVVPAKELVQEENSVEAFIIKALETNTPADTMEKLFSLRERVKAEQAKAAYIKALSEFQGKCPIIKKTKKVMNKDGKTVRYMFAPIDSIVEQIKKPLSESNLSYRWEVKQDKGSVKAVCIVTHILGHSESSDFDVGSDNDSYMTAPQKLASALTFAKRYSLCNALGISTGDEDTDATDVNKEATPKSPKSKIIFLLKTLKRETATKEQIESEVKKLTKLDLVEENYNQIVNYLEIIVQESHENPEIR